ncbi:MAG: hypothetical protein JO117_06160 [Verrucomicrobia bacterium]|nr:hypothetical protein [Verrucomicrobiota bacterium]
MSAVFSSSKHRPRAASGMLLLEVMLAVAIFALGVIGLGRCINNCLVIESFRAQDARACQALDNRAAEIQASLTLPDVSRKTELDAPYAGYTLIETRRPADLRNERGEALAGLFEITLRAEWKSRGATQSRETKFYLLREGF